MSENLPMTVPTPARKFRVKIPEAHKQSVDTRIRWLWHQRFGTVQMIYLETKDVLDRTACTLILQAIIGKDLDSILQVFQRLEGGAVEDKVLLDQEESIRV
jgi:hypothetical protein